MIDQFDQLIQLDVGEAVKLIVFILAAIAGTFAAYTMRWTEGPHKTIGYWRYMYNPPTIGRAAVKLFALCLGAGSMPYLDSLQGIHIIVAGAGVGYLVPQHIDKDTKEADHDKIV